MPLRARLFLCSLLGAVLFAIPASLAAGDYWHCSNGAWVANGDPAHPKPVKICDAKILRPETKNACRQRGGIWGPAGLSQRPICTLPTSDANAICADRGECEGPCLAEPSDAQRSLILKGVAVAMTGRCSPKIPVFGCQARVEKGFVRTILCVD